jgi:lipopolysaccharide/colanic/teichoic acid biosynthesis glycosyltransferase
VVHLPILRAPHLPSESQLDTPSVDVPPAPPLPADLYAADADADIHRLADDSPTPSPRDQAIKRFIDVTLAASGLVLTAPLVAALGVLVRLDSEGPALFYQRRVGLHQQTFTLVKLRTMNEEREVTRAGRWLRPLGLDELPQLWNVLVGDMSLVGPRPELPDLVDRYETDFPGYRGRHAMRPGITGWAQVNGLRGNINLSIAERLRFDLQYLRDWSLGLDVRILVRTVSTVLGDTIRSMRE